jgi:hypothetical protein
MWVQSGFHPDPFWDQTPRHFQLIMDGVRKRLKFDADARTSLAYESGAFAGLAHAGKLKALKHYIKQPSSKMSNQEMLANMRILAQRANRKAK